MFDISRDPRVIEDSGGMNSVERGTVTVEPNGAVKLDAAVTYPKSIVIGWLVPFEGTYNNVTGIPSEITGSPNITPFSTATHQGGETISGKRRTWAGLDRFIKCELKPAQPSSRAERLT